MLITSVSHPKLYQAFTYILLDYGAVNRQEPQPAEYVIPPSGESLVEAAERGLATLDEDEFCDMAYGEMDDALRLSQRSPDLKAAHTLLDLFFQYDPEDPNG